MGYGLRDGLRTAGLLALAGAAALAQVPGPRAAGTDWYRALTERAEAALGRRIRLDGMRCADTGDAGLVCKQVYRDRVIAVGAKATGPGTPKATGLRLREECVGLVSFDRPRCTFDVSVTPASVARGSVDAGRGKRPLVTVSADTFDLF